MPPVDKSIFNSKQNQGESYLDDLAFAVCVNGESLEKYKKIVEKQHGNDAYANMSQFVQTLRQQVERGQFTNTSLLNLKYLGKNAGMSEEAIDMIIDHFNSKVKEEQLIREEDEYWKHCDHNDKHALLEYSRKYPKGRYVKEAHAKINDINKEENAKREENAFWKQCNPNDKRQLNEYLKKYPKGIFVAYAKSLIADLERIEKTAIEESRVFNQCRTQRDYMNYLSKYPNGAYSTKAKTIIEDIGRKEIEENRAYNLCKDKKDYLDYIRKYPNGKYVKEAQEKIKTWGIDDNRKREETAFWNLCSPNDKSRLQEYLRKYPNGMYVIRAKSLIADLERFEKAAIEESRMYNQCRTRADYMEYLRQYPNGLYKSQAQSKINEFDIAAARERETYIQEQKIYDECKTKDDYLHYLNLYPNGKFVSRAHNKIEHFEKIAKIKKDVQKEKKENQKEPINDKVPDKIQNKLKKLNKAASYLYLIAALAFAFLPNVFRWNHWAYHEMEECGDAPTLWIFWLPIVVTIWGFYCRWVVTDEFSSISKTRKEMDGWYVFTVIPCSILLAWMFIKGQDISALLSIYMEDLHMFFMGPIICGIAWCAGLYCEYKMSRIAKDIDSGND